MILRAEQGRPEFPVHSILFPDSDSRWDSGRFLLQTKEYPGFRSFSSPDQGRPRYLMESGVFLVTSLRFTGGLVINFLVSGDPNWSEVFLKVRSGCFPL